MLIKTIFYKPVFKFVTVHKTVHKPFTSLYTKKDNCVQRVNICEQTENSRKTALLLTLREMARNSVNSCELRTVHNMNGLQRSKLGAFSAHNCSCEQCERFPATPPQYFSGGTL